MSPESLCAQNLCIFTSKSLNEAVFMATAEQSNTEQGGGRRARGGAEARRHARQKPPIVQNPYIRRNIPLVTVLDEEGLVMMEHNADTILQEIGLEFRDEPEALELW